MTLRYKLNYFQAGGDNKEVAISAMDTLVWQAFASVIVPGSFSLSLSLSLTHTGWQSQLWQAFASVIVPSIFAAVFK